ncbi:MAG: hypothetical protein ACTHN0_00520 [Aquihabitans sp.]
MAQIIETDRRPVAAAQVEERRPAGSGALRIFQVVSAIAGAVLFGMGLAAVFDVDFGGDLLATSGVVAGFGFSPVGAIAAVVLGAAILISTLADQDRAGAALIGFITLAVGIAALVAEDQATDVQVDNRSAALFIALGAVVFVCSLVPWWSRRRVTTVVR